MTPGDTSSIPILLEHPHNETLSSEDVDFQLRMYDLGVERPAKTTRAAPCLVVLTRSDDMEVSELSLGLARRGLRLLRVNRDDPPGRSITTVSPNGMIDSHGELLHAEVVWVRYFLDPVDRSSINYLQASYTHTQIDALPGTLLEVAENAVNGQSQITSRLGQLAQAQAFGYGIPPTIVTHDISVASGRLLESDADALIVKPIGSHWTELNPGTLVGTFATRLSATDASSRPLEPAPVVTQRYVPHDYELRVFIVGRRLVPYKVAGKSSAHTLWTAPESVRVERVTLNRKEEERILQFAVRTRIDIGAIEFLVQRDGSLVFMELNLLCDWRFFQKKAGDTSVTDALLDHFEQELRCR